MESSSTSNGRGKAADGAGGTPPPAPAPMPNANAPPPFLVKTYDMVDDPSSDKIVSWSSTNNSFVVWDPPEFARDLLPKYFKHSNFSSFVRQLNTYGFRKVDPDRWEFANEGFLRGQKHLLKSISRRKPAHGHTQQQPHGQSSSVSACVEVGKFGLEEELERLKRDKNVLMQELVRLRQQQQTTDGQLQTMVQRFQGMEQRQQQMMSFLAKAANSPGFLAQFVQQQNDSSRRVTEGSKKRRLKQDGLSDNNSVGRLDGQIVKYKPVMNEASKAMLQQLMEHDTSPRHEKFCNSSDSFFISDGSSNKEMECGNTLSRVSEVTLKEVPPSSGQSFIPTGLPITGHSSSASMPEIQPVPICATSMIVGDQLSGISPLDGSQDLPPVTLSPPDMILSELSQLPNIIPESNVSILAHGRENGSFVDPTSLGVNGKVPLDIPPDSQIDWNLLQDGMEDLPESTDPFWDDMFLQSSALSIETEDMESTPAEDRKDGEMKPLNNGWNKAQRMKELTEQMGLLTSDAKKVQS